MQEAAAINGCDAKWGMVGVRFLTFSQNFSEKEHSRREKIAVRDRMEKSWESPDVMQAPLGLGKGPDQPETVDPVVVSRLSTDLYFHLIHADAEPLNGTGL